MHLTLRHELGLLTESLDEEQAAADRELQEWLGVLAERNLLRDSVPEGETHREVENQVLALYRFLRETRCRVLNVALVDAVGDRRVQNQPGTDKEYPNWRVPLSDPNGEPLLLEQVFRSERPMRLAAVLNGFVQVPKPWSPPEG